MIFSESIARTKILSIMIMILLFLFVVSFIANIFLSYAVYSNKDDSNVIIIPMNNSGSYHLTNKQYDMNYLRDMGTSFVNLRLNVTPESIDDSHHLLLSYFDNEDRGEMADILNKESKIIKEDDLSTAFYINKINIYPEYDVYEVIGILKSWSTSLELPPVDKKYQLKVSYKNGVLKLIKFIEVHDENKK